MNSAQMKKIAHQNEVEAQIQVKSSTEGQRRRISAQIQKFFPKIYLYPTIFLSKIAILKRK